MVTQYLGQQPHIMKASGRAASRCSTTIGEVLTWPATHEQVEAASKLVPDEIVQMLTASGTPDECRAKVAEYVADGLHLPDPLPAGRRDGHDRRLRRLGRRREQRLGEGSGQHVHSQERQVRLTRCDRQALDSAVLAELSRASATQLRENAAPILCRICGVVRRQPILTLPPILVLSRPGSPALGSPPCGSTGRARHSRWSATGWPPAWSTSPSDLAALDGGGFWAVVCPFDGPAVLRPLR